MPDDHRRANFIQILADPCQGSFADGNHPIFAALALANDDRSPVGIKVINVKVGKLCAANAGRIQRFQ